MESYHESNYSQISYPVDSHLLESYHESNFPQIATPATPVDEYPNRTRGVRGQTSLKDHEELREKVIKTPIMTAVPDHSPLLLIEMLDIYSMG